MTGAAANRPSRPVAGDSREWMTDEERRAHFERRQESLDHNLLEVQRARFIARARNESPEELDRLDRSFADLQGRRQENLTQLRTLGSFE